jgi:methylase of polypeptide subunit release factors
MKLSKDLERQEIWAEGNELVSILGRDRNEKGERIHTRPYSEKELVAEIMDPLILTDINAISKLEPTKRDTVFSLYQSYPRTVEYDDVTIRWDPRVHIDVWGPTMDTLVFENAIRTTGDVLTDNVYSAVDIGCGPGSIGEYVLRKCKNLKRLHLVDLNPYAIKCAMDNVQRLHENQTVTYSVGDGRKLAEEKFDLVACSPPYVPREESADDNPYEGISLHHDMIVNGKNYLNDEGKLILTTSSLCERIKDEAIERAYKEGRLERVDVIAKKRIPLKVMAILNNDKWMKYLHEMGLQKTPERGYEYWHEISILKLEYY